MYSADFAAKLCRHLDGELSRLDQHILDGNPPDERTYREFVARRQQLLSDRQAVVDALKQSDPDEARALQP